MLCEPLLEVSVELEGVFLGDNDADLLTLRVEISQNTLCHALKPTLDQSIRHDDILNERLKTAGNVEVAHLE